MLIDIRHRDHPVSDALRDFAQRRVTRVLRPFQEAVSRVDVRTKDVNGPRGGVDNECSVMVELAHVEEPLLVTGKGTDAYVAIADATRRLHETTSRALGRRRARSDDSLSRAVPRGTAIGSGPAEAPPGVNTVDESSEVVVTETDEARLRKLIEASQDTRERDAVDALADELDRAEVVPSVRIAGNVVTMNSRVVFQDDATGERREVSLVYPQDSNFEQGRISILAPVGTALLGLSIGQTIDWPLPQGRLKRYRVLEVVYQPEAAGDLHL